MVASPKVLTVALIILTIIGILIGMVGALVYKVLTQ
jgi:hypothetical protein